MTAWKAHCLLSQLSSYNWSELTSAESRQLRLRYYRRPNDETPSVVFTTRVLRPSENYTILQLKIWPTSVSSWMQVTGREDQNASFASSGNTFNDLCFLTICLMWFVLVLLSSLVFVQSKPKCLFISASSPITLIKVKNNLSTKEVAPEPPSGLLCVLLWQQVRASVSRHNIYLRKGSGQLHGCCYMNTKQRDESQTPMEGKTLTNDQPKYKMRIVLCMLNNYYISKV